MVDMPFAWQGTDNHKSIIFTVIIYFIFITLKKLTSGIKRDRIKKKRKEMIDMSRTYRFFNNTTKKVRNQTR